MYEPIDYINTNSDIREHLRRINTWRTLCGIEIEGARGCPRGYQYPAAGNAPCKSCIRMRAFYEEREAKEHAHDVA